jgi:hypothetical protein
VKHKFNENSEIKLFNFVSQFVYIFQWKLVTEKVKIISFVKHTLRKITNFVFNLTFLCRFLFDKCEKTQEVCKYENVNTQTGVALLTFPKIEI